MTEIRLNAGVIELNGEPIAKLNDGLFEPHIVQEFDRLLDTDQEDIFSQEDVYSAMDEGRADYAIDAVRMIKGLDDPLTNKDEELIIKKLERLV